MISYENKNYNTNGDLTDIYYNSKNDKFIPCDSYIGVSYKSQSLTLEFSSKILLYDYPKLITQATFRQCLENINKLNICTIDADRIVIDCYFSKTHITNDIDSTLTGLAIHQQKQFKTRIAEINLSNYEPYVDYALQMSCELGGLWKSFDIVKKEKLQNLVFPEGVFYDQKIKGY